MIITDIIPSTRKSGRFDVVIDGRRHVRLSIEAIERLKLASGVELNDATARAIDRETALLATYDRALDMLAMRARSAAELRRLLVRKGEPAEFVDVAVARLLAAGILDDAEFARQFARGKVLGAGYSRGRLLQELRRRGVSRDVAVAAIEAVFSEERLDEAASIERVARKKLQSLRRLDAPTQRRRLYAFLARRGFDSDDIVGVMRTLMTADAAAAAATPDRSSVEE